ncbi:MAG TPA: SMI1/KNR4 family protein [Streptosporangiaceae bacterium]|nr:SMI1/KNR4 family protein [Streptosporangiaceae bacterium]
MSALDDLIALAPPPPQPVDAHGDWGQVEASLGLRLPQDFKDLIGRYGLGQFTDFISPLTPFGPRRQLVERAGELKEQARYWIDDQFEEQRYPFYPDPGGLLEWALTDNGDSLFWLTAGEPDDWIVVAASTRPVEYSVHHMGAAAFLRDWLNRALTGTALVDNTPGDVWFRPYQEFTQVYIKLSESLLPYDTRLRILRKALAPTASRGSFRSASGNQSHFDAVDLGWMLTYETAYGHQIRVSFPPGDYKRVKTTLFEAVARMGCAVTEEQFVQEP